MYRLWYMHTQLPCIIVDDSSGVSLKTQIFNAYLRSFAMLYIFKNWIFDKYSRNTLRALRSLILDNISELIRTRTNSGSIGLFKLFDLNKDNRPQRTQRAQGLLVLSVLYVVFSNTYLPIDNDFFKFQG